MKRIFLLLAFSLLIISCTESKTNPPIVENAVDNVESSPMSSLKQGRYSENMVHQIYNELMKNDKNLKMLDEKIIDINDKTQKTISRYEDVINKSAIYYNDAEHLTRAITDSITKEQVKANIKTSAEKYELKTKNITNLIQRINENQSKIKDQYIVFRIKKTIPEIEKYQQAHPLKTDSLTQFINKQNQLLAELKNFK
ncbi:hypothetical protein [Chryseobacterium sp. FH1]|uniref:hypothetical protein n=1 Tax=Chryseobacterium sp. FH1 TaxID=1233951 RepID=UPI0004E3C43B|nr:hypothetical protein [Chryseobacterium sp. FH1]KFC20485.1 hypothetical protein IO90_15135 [Chryseobacterium sp. FH1]